MTGTRQRCSVGARHLPWPLCRRCCGIALDMGSARTRVWIAGRGVVVDAPTVTVPGDGGVHPVQRGTIIDTPGCARMLHRLLDDRLPRSTRPLVILTAPVLDGVAYRDRARTAVDALHPRGVLTVPAARGIALAAGADLLHPVLVVDIGAHLTEAALLCDGAVADACRAALGTTDLDGTATPELIADTVARMLATMRRQDRTDLTAGALRRGVLLAGGGALRPGIAGHLAARLEVRPRVVQGAGTAAVRGAARLLEAAHTHPSIAGPYPPAGLPR